jgi:hypothetical protein
LGSDAAPSAEPVGGACARWRRPDDGHAAFRRLEWDEEAACSEAEVWTAREVLGGRCPA